MSVSVAGASLWKLPSPTPAAVRRLAAVTVPTVGGTVVLRLAAAGPPLATGGERWRRARGRRRGVGRRRGGRRGAGPAVSRAVLRRADGPGGALRPHGGRPRTAARRRR